MVVFKDEKIAEKAKILKIMGCLLIKVIGIILLILTIE